MRFTPIACSALAVLLAFCGTVSAAPGMFDAAGPNAQSVADVFWLVIAICTVIFLAVFSTMVWVVLRFREHLDDGETEPPQIYGSEPIEIAWTLAPAMVVLIIGLVIIRSVTELRASPTGENVERIRVVGHQWWWEYEYPDYGFTTANEIVIPASDPETPRPVDLQLESADVMHSFWVPRLAGKTDNIPNKTNTMWIQADHEGTYFGRCAEYCGTQHTKMLIRVDAVSPEAFADWVAEQQKPAVDDPTVAEGRELFLSMACANCHTIRGTRSDGKFGPDLTHLMSRKTLAAGVVDNNRENLTLWMEDPHQIKDGCYMPDMRISARETKLIVDYLMTLE